MRLLKERNITDIMVIGGGIIPEKDVDRLKEEGIAKTFGPGTSLSTIAEYIREKA
jgi:methylmalonyl-CoA mutase C-terminal domain/subunit